MSIREAEAERLRQVWKQAVPGSLLMKPWLLLEDDVQNRWQSILRARLSDAADLFQEEP